MRGWPAAGAPGAAAALLTLLLLPGCGRDGAEGNADAPAAEAAEEVELAVDLYFPGPGGRLYPEHRRLAASGDGEAQAAAVLEALLAGPEGDGLEAPFAGAVELGEVYLAPGGIAYVDLEAPGGEGPPAAGSTEEMQIVFSLVNSLSLNLPQVERVVLLWNGVQPTSLSGHLDTRSPLAPDPGLVVRE